MSRKDKGRTGVNEQKIEELKNRTYGKIGEEGDISERYRQITEKVGRSSVLIPLENLENAPDDWNEFPEISDSKKIEMFFSILQYGLFNPIIVWELEPNSERYMILAGHNRVKTYKDIYERYKDEDLDELMLQANDEETISVLERFDLESYKNIDAFIYKHDELTEEMAQEIIMDTNYIQREEDKKTLNKIVVKRLNLTKKRKDLKGNTMQNVAKAMNLSATKVFEETAIAEKIIPELQEYYYNSTITRKSILAIRNLSEEIQKWLVEEQPERIKNKYFMKVDLKQNYTKKDLEKLFENIDEEELAKKENVKVTFEVDKELEEEFKKMAQTWLKNKKYYNKNKKDTVE